MTMQVKEAFDAVRKEKGEVKFAQTKLDDAHIKKIIADISKKSGVTEQDILDDIKKKMKKFDDLAVKSPILYATCQRNIVENEVFKLVEEAEKKGYGIKSPVKFSTVMFNRLITAVTTEHKQFFPMRNFMDHKTLHNPIIIFVPSTIPEEKKWNVVKTAAATPRGQFIFNKVFMQSLLDFAHYKDIKPKGKKYECNGGEIPNGYAYIEFLIIHEFMHYTGADFKYQQILKAKNKIINWIGDFRTNYLLVKSGYEQLPIGLYSDDVNYDRQKTYREMFETVKAEFDKLSAANKKLVTDTVGKIQGGKHTPKISKTKAPLKPDQCVTTPSGAIRKIVKVHPDGKVDVRELTPEEKIDAEKAYKQKSILGMPQQVKDALK